jgi:hypothetical protein
MGGGGEGGQQRGGGNNMTPGNGQRNQAPQGNKPAAALPKPAEGVVYEAAGTWNFTIDSPQAGGGTIVLRKENGVHTGTVKTARMTEETVFTAVTVKGNELTLSYTASFGGNTVPVDIKAVLTADTDMQGTMQLGQFRTFNIAGKKAN